MQSPQPHNADYALTTLKFLLHFYPFQYLDMPFQGCCPESFEAFLASASLLISIHYGVVREDFILGHCA